MIVVDVEVDSLDRDAWHLWSHEQGMLALCPLPSTNVLQFQAGIAPTDDPELSLANMQTILERLSRRTDIRLHEPVWSSLWRANEILNVRQQLEAPEDLLDSEGHLFSAYSATTLSLVLIRPDGYIGLISDTGAVSDVSDYLRMMA